MDCGTQWGAAARRRASRATPWFFLGAAAFQWVNPKAWIMALGYFSNYMPPDASMIFIVLTCLMFSAINFPSVGVWVWLGAQLERHLQNDALRRAFNGTMALLLLASMLPVLLA
jgi:threonine/homoserine/homoserine lactone efflux protein